MRGSLRGYGVRMKFGAAPAFGVGNVSVLRLARTVPGVVAAAVVALVGGCSWIQPSNQVLAAQGESAAPSARPNPSPSDPAASAQPAWVRALGAGVVVTAPAAAAPGDDSPGAAVQGYFNALIAGKPIQACTYYPPSGQASCRKLMAAVGKGSIPTLRDLALGYVVVDGNKALVGFTGTVCAPDETPACRTNDDPAAIFSDAQPFPHLWAESVAADTSSSGRNSYSLAPCVEVGSNWYVYNPGQGGNT
jgi:hypothetical protein